MMRIVTLLPLMFTIANMQNNGLEDKNINRSKKKLSYSFRPRDDGGLN